MKKLVKFVLKLGGLLSMAAGVLGIIMEQHLIEGLESWLTNTGYLWIGISQTDDILEWLSVPLNDSLLLAGGLAAFLIGCVISGKRDKKSDPMLLYGSKNGYVIMPSYADELGTSYQGCTELTGITISGAVKELEPYALSGCTALMRVHILGDNLRRIGFNAFSGCSGLQEIHIPDSVIEIGMMAFCGCSSLTGIRLPKGLKTIQTGTFSGCSGLHELTLPEGLENIERNAFHGCTSLERLIIPASVKNIGEGAFLGCSNLRNVKIMGSGKYTFISANAFTGCPCTIELCS